MPDFELTSYDSTDYLDSEEAIATYLDAATIEGGDDPTYTAHVQAIAARARTKIAATSTASDVKPKRQKG